MVYEDVRCLPYFGGELSIEYVEHRKFLLLVSLGASCNGSKNLHESMELFISLLFCAVSFVFE